MGRDDVLAAAPHLAGSLLPAVRFATRKEPDAGMDVGHTKLGGAPDLPRGTAWPSWDAPGGEHRLLQFVAQVDLGVAAAAAPAPLGLPADGLLSFFADHPGGSASIILYTPASEPLVRCGLRMEPIPPAQLRPLPLWTWPSGNDDLAAAVEARLRPALPEGWHVSGRHQLGGHGLAPTEPGWRLLLQIDADNTLELHLGSLRWTVPSDALAAARWDAHAFALQPA
jgi:hypothetical protein